MSANKDGYEGAAREAVLRAMQGAAESAAGKNGVPKGPKGTRGIVMLSNDVSWASPEDKRKKKKWDESEGAEAEGAGPMSSEEEEEEPPRCRS